MARRVHLLTLPLVFPAGLAAGEDGNDNRLSIARDGAGTPVLRGTSLAGRLRHAWRKRMTRGAATADVAAIDAAVARFFGSAASNGDEYSRSGTASPLRVSDVALMISHNDKRRATVVERTHHLRDRHTGVVAHGALFSMEACPPGTTGHVTLWLHDDDPSPAESLQFLASIVSLFQLGATLGGKTARGVGVANLKGTVSYRRYDLEQADEHARYLDDQLAWRNSPSTFSVQDAWSDKLLTSDAAAGTDIKIAEEDRLCVTVTLGIPRGQDLLVADGQGIKCDAEPQRVVDAQGRLLWRLPGSSLRGLFRAWFTRLAARENAAGRAAGDPSIVADNVERRDAVAHGRSRPEDELNGDNLGWAFLPKDQRKTQLAETACPVSKLFGTLFGKGRIHVSDAYAGCSQPDAGDATELIEEQMRRHVAVDAVSGGAVENLLFENSVLVPWTGESTTSKPTGDKSAASAKARSPRFQVQIQIESPTADEVRWLVKTLKALDVGVLRVGSSKSSGRLSLVRSPEASGPFSESLRAVVPYFQSESFPAS